MDVASNVSVISKYCFPIKCIDFYQQHTLLSIVELDHIDDGYVSTSLQSVIDNFLKPLDDSLYLGKVIELNRFIDSNANEFYIERTYIGAKVFESFPKHWTLHLLASKHRLE